MDGVEISGTALLHQKAVCRPMGTATETVIELLDCRDRKGRGFLAVKRAQTKEVGTRFLEFDDATNDLDDVDACQQVLDECLRDQSRRPASGSYTHLTLPNNRKVEMTGGSTYDIKNKNERQIKYQMLKIKR